MKNVQYLLPFIFLFSSFSILAQDESAKNWKTLSNLEYKVTKDEYGELRIPKFDENIKSLEGKSVELSGYIVPFEGMFKPTHLIISSVPIASCFFCGGAGPESVAEVYLSESVKYTSKKVTVTGVLSLNDSDTDQLMYILKEAELKTN